MYQKLTALLRSHWTLLRQMFSYGVIGVLAAVVDTCIFMLLVDELGWVRYAANLLSAHCGMVFSFLFNRIFTFDARDRIGRRFLLFYCTALFGLLLSTFILWAGPFFCGEILYVKIFAVVAVAAVQFLLNRTFAFGRARSKD